MEFICLKVNNSVDGFTKYNVVGDVFEYINEHPSRADFFLLKHKNTGIITFHKKDDFISVQDIRNSKLNELGI